MEFIGSITLDDDYRVVCEKLAKEIHFDLKSFRGCGSYRESFAYLRDCLETSGIFVILADDLGSHHTKIAPQAFRGYSISDPIAPFIVINDNDSRAAWSFTALHECCHLWLGDTDISGMPNSLAAEVFCNRVSSEILLSEAELTSISSAANQPIDGLYEMVSSFSAERNLSRSMVAYRFLRSEFIGEAEWQELVRRFDQDRRDKQDSQHPSKTDKGGPSYYVF